MIIIHRPTAEDIRKHCFFWPEETQILFLIAVHDRFPDKNDNQDELLKKLNDSNVIKAKWGEYILPKTPGGTISIKFVQ